MVQSVKILQAFSEADFFFLLNTSHKLELKTVQYKIYYSDNITHYPLLHPYS